ncbi:dcn1-like protein 4 [Moniliophthora roreri]|nr:dcn1-like protein 4 [Moniliophthora roreri]
MILSRWRKRADEPETTEEAASSSATRATRRSTRNPTKTDANTTSEASGSTSKTAKQTKTTKATTSKKAPAKAAGDEGDAPVPKKARTATKTSSKPTKGKKGQSDDQREQSTSKANGTKEAQTTNTQTASELYTPANALTLFNKYADASEPDVIGPEGLETLCKDADISMEGVQPMILAWQMHAKEMGKFTKDEWVKGTTTLKVSSLPAIHSALSELEDLLIFDKPAVKPSKNEPYNRASYWQYAKDKKSAFHEVYNFCFSLAKAEQSRNLDMEIATALWSVLLPPKYPIMTEILGFINEKGTYKAANKDLWVMMLEFLESVKPTLEDYDEGGGAWPTLLDDFVEWKRAQTGASSS